jgi:hypothetical protein
MSADLYPLQVHLRPLVFDRGMIRADRSTTCPPHGGLAKDRACRFAWLAIVDVLSVHLGHHELTSLTSCWTLLGGDDVAGLDGLHPADRAVDEGGQRIDADLFSPAKSSPWRRTEFRVAWSVSRVVRVQLSYSRA